MASKVTNSLRGPINNLSAKFTERFTLPERFKGTIVEKWSLYWKNLCIDYKEVIVDTGRKMKTKPIKTGILSCIAGSLYYCGTQNPDFEAFNEQLRLYNNQMILIAADCQNKNATDYLIYLERCANQGLLRRITIGIVSFLWIDNYNEALAIYKATCPYLEPQYLKFHERIIDVGFMNTWWKLQERMVDYDVNITEL